MHRALAIAVVALIACRASGPLRDPRATDDGGAGCLLLRDNRSGVVGMDVASSVPLDGSRSLFVFGDSFIGSWSGDRRRITGAVESAAAVVDDRQADTCFAGASFLRGASPARILAAAVERGDARTWPGPLARVEDKLLVGFRVAKVDPAEGLGFRDAGAGLAFVRLEDPRVELSRSPAIAADAPAFSALLVVDGWVYGYRCAQRAGAHPCVVGRAPAANATDLGAWRYYSVGAGFEAALGVASQVVDGSPDFTVRWNPYLRAFAMVSIAPFSREVLLRTAPRPEGPFSAPRAIATCRVPASEPSAYCYAAKEHPQLGGDDGRVAAITYSTNATSLAALEREPELYLPRLVRVDLAAMAIGFR